MDDMNSGGRSDRCDCKKKLEPSWDGDVFIDMPDFAFKRKSIMKHEMLGHFKKMCLRSNIFPIGHVKKKPE